MGQHVRVLDSCEHALSAGGSALAAAYLKCEVGTGEDGDVVRGVGLDPTIAASLKGATSQVNRARA